MKIMTPIVVTDENVKRLGKRAKQEHKRRGRKEDWEGELKDRLPEIYAFSGKFVVRVH